MDVTHSGEEGDMTKPGADPIIDETVGCLIPYQIALKFFSAFASKATKTAIPGSPSSCRLSGLKKRIICRISKNKK